ncbi:hypothetical protein OHU34_02105 [Streptomyces sp. NBC_00080]|nr:MULTISPECIES: hypothetical protein [Streptomyces]
MHRICRMDSDGVRRVAHARVGSGGGGRDEGLAQGNQEADAGRPDEVAG